IHQACKSRLTPLKGGTEMTRKLLSVVLMCSLIITILAACGGNNNNGAAGNDNSGSNTSTNTPQEKPGAVPAEENNQYGDTGGLTLPLVDKPTKITWMLVGES